MCLEFMYITYYYYVNDYFLSYAYNIILCILNKRVIVFKKSFDIIYFDFIHSYGTSIYYF